MGTGWHSGINLEVSFTARVPAMVAVAMTEPFLSVMISGVPWDLAFDALLARRGFRHGGQCSELTAMALLIVGVFTAMSTIDGRPLCLSMCVHRACDGFRALLASNRLVTSIILCCPLKRTPFLKIDDVSQKTLRERGAKSAIKLNLSDHDVVISGLLFSLVKTLFSLSHSSLLVLCSFYL